MIQNIKINAIHSDLDDNLKKYINKKLGHLDKYVSRDLRPKLFIEVFLKEVNAKDKNNCRFEANLLLPNEKISALESTLNMYAAVDIVEDKLKHQLVKYNQKNHSAKFYRHIIRKFTKKSAI
jgi:ribosomal subunit interface protein